MHNCMGEKKNPVCHQYIRHQLDMRVELLLLFKLALMAYLHVHHLLNSIC